jgi:hypothetical protein
VRDRHDFAGPDLARRPVGDRGAADLVRRDFVRILHAPARHERGAALAHVQDVGVELVHLGHAGRVAAARVDLVGLGLEQRHAVLERGLHLRARKLMDLIGAGSNAGSEEYAP